MDNTHDDDLSFGIIKCYGFAWKSFSKWWIPLCLISGAVFIINILPRLFTKGLVGDVTQKVKLVFLALGDEVLLMVRLEELNEAMVMLAKATVQYSLILFPFAILFSTLLLLYATFAVHNEKNKYPIKAIVWVGIARLTMTLVKFLAFLLFIFPGIYLYIKLFFVPLFMFEKRQGMWQAVKSSWWLTDGYFMDVLALVALNIVVQLSASSTIIGVIPVFGFTNTVRAAAFRMILHDKETAPGPPPLPVAYSLDEPVA